MKQILAEEFINKLGCDIYPITLIKALLNRKRILLYFSKAAEKNFVIRGVKYKLDHSDCERCKERESEGILCRQHVSIKRVMSATNVAYDTYLNAYFYKNEIFKMVGDRLVIVYCPHPKLISGKITDEKVRKVNPVTVEDPEIRKLPNYNVTTFSSEEIYLKNVRCWFNKEFSIVTLPITDWESDFCLMTNY